MFDLTKSSEVIDFSLVTHIFPTAFIWLWINVVNGITDEKISARGKLLGFFVRIKNWGSKIGTHLNIYFLLVYTLCTHLGLSADFFHLFQMIETVSSHIQSPRVIQSLPYSINFTISHTKQGLVVLFPLSFNIPKATLHNFAPLGVTLKKMMENVIW